MSKIYALCDKNLLKRFNLKTEDFVKIAKFFNSSLIQYRNKNMFFEEIKEDLLILKKSGIPVIVNDYLEFTQFADGLHLGQEDILNLIESFGFKSRYEAVKGIRKIVGKKIIGLSTHNETEIKEANILDIDYIGLGAYRDTKTKKVENFLGEKLHCLANLSKHPVAAIGGVRVFDNIEGVYYKAIGTDLFVKYLSYS